MSSSSSRPAARLYFDTATAFRYCWSSHRWSFGRPRPVPAQAALSNLTKSAHLMSESTMRILATDSSSLGRALVASATHCSLVPSGRERVECQTQTSIRGAPACLSHVDIMYPTTTHALLTSLQRLERRIPLCVPVVDSTRTAYSVAVLVLSRLIQARMFKDRICKPRKLLQQSRFGYLRTRNLVSGNVQRLRTPATLVDGSQLYKLLCAPTALPIVMSTSRSAGSQLGTVTKPSRPLRRITTSSLDAQTRDTQTCTPDPKFSTAGPKVCLSSLLLCQSSYANRRFQT